MTQLNPLQITAYAFGSVNALFCIAMFFMVTKNSGLSLFQRLASCLIGISAVAYLSLRIVLLYEGVH